MRYHNISKDDMLNGDGIRVVLWVAGCEHACAQCHNPETWDPQGGLVFDAQAKQELFAELNKDYVSGVTFSGGDPLFTNNVSSIANLVHEVKESFPKKTIWLYTGYEYEDVKDYAFLQQVDVLVDGKYMEELKDAKLHWKGSSNQRVIDVKKSIEAKQVVLY